VELTYRQFELLRLLTSEPGRVYDREQILRHLNNGEDSLSDLRGVNVFVQHIRKQIEPDPENPRYIKTVKGFGYRFAEL
jgi:two-component system, OmpR family, alkaline phosphatase synthesis response regulator PhoP